MKSNDFKLLTEKLNIGDDKLMEFALETEFIKRKRLITASNFLYAVCLESSYGVASYNDIAAHIDVANSVSVSRQAICQKVTKPCEDFLKKTLAAMITKKLNMVGKEIVNAKKLFKRILVHDSTIIKLPIRLFSDYSGVGNCDSHVCNARIQCTYDLISEQFISFSIDPYSKNDLKVAPEMPLEENDLVLRDRGYFTNDEIQRHIDNKAHCIYRYKFGMILKDPKTEKPIDLLALLKNNTMLDRLIMLNNKEKTIIRILACPVPKEIGDHRRMKAKKENKYTPSKEYLETLSWSIYITTLTDKSIDYTFIFKAYGLRWRIEIIFKCWKSNMGFNKIHNVSKTQLNAWLLARFIMIIIVTHFIFKTCNLIIKKKYKKDLSIMKLTKYLQRNPIMIIYILNELNNFNVKRKDCLKSLNRYCTYDKRKRTNYQQKFDEVYSLS